jgi:osmoprotectant transport system ATP-binding protein
MFGFPDLMGKIVFRNVTKTFQGFDAVRDISFQVREGETLVLIGTSGCGKTTTLKMINRLVEPTSGQIQMQGRNISEYDLIELRRSIGYVIQSVGLFPHMTIEKNIAVVPELMGWTKEKVAARVRELLAMVGLDPDTYRMRYPAELSGGQQQRIGVARALAADPPVILMDEPFGALDPITREQLQNEFLGLVQEIRKTIVFVTHDIFEAVKLADRLALMDKGQIVQLGTPKEIIEAPAHKYVADFLGRQHFQLALLMTKLDEIMDAPGPLEGQATVTPASWHLSPDDTVLDALNYFKLHKTDTVPVKGKDKGLAGVVSKDSVRKSIFEGLL